MYPLCLVSDIFFIYQELKAIHLRTLNRERAEMLADHFVTHGTVRTPADISRGENVLLRSNFDRCGLPVRFVPIHELYDSNAELEAAATGCQGSFVMHLCRRGKRGRHRRQRAAAWPPWGRGDCFIGIALHRDATHLQALTAVLAACAARRKLQRVGLGGGGRIDKHTAHAGPQDWWREDGTLTEGALQCMEQGREYGLRHGRDFATVLVDFGWLSKVFMLGKAERARFSTKLKRTVGGVRWLTFR